MTFEESESIRLLKMEKRLNLTSILITVLLSFKQKRQFILYNSLIIEECSGRALQGLSKVFITEDLFRCILPTLQEIVYRPNQHRRRL